MNLEIVTLAEAKEEAAQHAARCNLTLLIHGQRVPFETANEASGIVRELRDESGMGSRAFGSQFAIVDKSGKEVGWVSYNGRVWQGTRKNWKQSVCVFPSETTWPKEWQNGKSLCAS